MSARVKEPVKLARAARIKVRADKAVRAPWRMRSSESVKKAGHVKEQGRDINQTVDPVQDCAVTWNGGAHVFDADVAFNHADGKVAELTADTDDQTREHK